MAKDTLLLKPMEDNVDEYIKLLANFCSINENLLKIVYDYFKQETFLILSLFAEQKITFPSVKNMDIIKQKLKIYYIMNEKMKESKDFEAVQGEVSLENGITINQAYTWWKECADILKQK